MRAIMEIAKIRFNNHIIQKIAELNDEKYQDLMQGGYHQYIKRNIKLLKRFKFVLIVIHVENVLQCTKCGIKQTRY